MVRAAAKGLVDYAKCDPYDRWWWRRHNLLIEELGTETEAKIFAAKSQHWHAAACSTGEKAAAAMEYADRAMTEYICRMAPWLEDLIRKELQPVTPEEMASAYEEELGRPGEEEYEVMVDNLERLLDSQSAEGKLKERMRRMRDTDGFL